MENCSALSKEQLCIFGSPCLGHDSLLKVMSFSTVKQKVDKINSLSRAFSRNGRWIFIMPLDF